MLRITGNPTRGGRELYRVQTRSGHGTDAQEDGIHVGHALPWGGGQVEDDAGHQACHDEIHIVKCEKITRREHGHGRLAHGSSQSASCTELSVARGK